MFMLVGKQIRLRIAEKEDVPQLVQWLNDVDFADDYQHFPDQISKAELEKRIVEQKLYQNEWVDYVIEKKDGAKIGWAVHYLSLPNLGVIEVGYAIAPEERNKDYATEAIQILVDYLFLTRDIVRIQAIIDSANEASRKAVEKAGFKKEGTLREALWNAEGKWADGDLYGILRSEWKQPEILTKP
jgi:ribosomal-protein-alanine N-acetyltransferase